MATLNLPPYSVFPRLNGDRIILREVLPDDFEALVEISFYDGVRAENVGDAKEMQERIEADYAAGASVHWCIVDKDSSQVLGTCGYYRGFENGAGELGCILLPQHRGKGYMTPALTLATNFGLQTIGLQRVWALTDRENIKARTLLERLKFEKIAEHGDEVEYTYIA